MAGFHVLLASLGFESYDDYLRSQHWAAFKQAYKKAQRPMNCAVCGGHPIQLHHHTYVNLGKEKLEDVDPLCRKHHEDVHEWLRKNEKFVEHTHLAIASLRGEVVVTKKAKKKAKKLNEAKLNSLNPKEERMLRESLRKKCTGCGVNTPRHDHEFCRRCQRLGLPASAQLRSVETRKEKNRRLLVESRKKPVQTWHAWLEERRPGGSESARKDQRKKWIEQAKKAME